VGEAVLRMGTGQVLALAIAAGTRPALQARLPAYGLGEGALWRHSVAAAVAIECVPGLGHCELPPEAFTAALLHDIGKLVMARFLDPEILGYIRRAQDLDHLGRLEAESLLLGVNHAELGGLIAQHWKLPPRVVLGITYHHHPEEGSDVICELTCLANIVAKHIEARLDGQASALAVVPAVAERLCLAEEAIERLGPLALDRFRQVRRRYNVS
jgi:HD-like signal output (HDOD) protein